MAKGALTLTQSKHFVNRLSSHARGLNSERDKLSSKLDKLTKEIDAAVAEKHVLEAERNYVQNYLLRHKFVPLEIPIHILQSKHSIAYTAHDVMGVVSRNTIKYILSFKTTYAVAYGASNLAYNLLFQGYLTASTKAIVVVALSAFSDTLLELHSNTIGDGFVEVNGWQSFTSECGTYVGLKAAMQLPTLLRFGLISVGFAAADILSSSAICYHHHQALKPNSNGDNYVAILVVAVITIPLIVETLSLTERSSIISGVFAAINLFASSHIIATSVSEIYGLGDILCANLPVLCGDTQEPSVDM